MIKRVFHRVWNWVDDRTGLPETIGKMARHLVPPDAKWWYVFGSATLCAFVIQVVSGVALAFSYIPSASEAYMTLRFISDQAPFGHFLRGLHYYGASAMVLMVGLHMAQVFLFGSYKFPRELSWATGVLLLGFTLVMGFTGQLLRWDQNAVWSVVVAAEQAGRVPLFGNWLAHFTLGGNTVGGATLTRFFVIHVFIMPAFIFAFVGLHLWLVLRHGISEPPKVGHPVDPKVYRQQYEELMAKKGCPFWPDAAWRDVVFCVTMIVGLAALALIFGAPDLGKPPDPSIIEASPRPDWYLLWYFGVLALLPHGTEEYFMVFGPFLAGVLLIALPFISNRGERSLRRRPWAVAAVLMTVVMIATLWVAGAQSPWSPNFNAPPLSLAVVGATSGPVFVGAQLFHAKGCLNCHAIAQNGGRRGPDLTDVASRLSKNQMILRISNGGGNMPAYAGNLVPPEMDALVAFLQSRKFTVHPLEPKPSWQKSQEGPP
jgi:ubiquinol-cytochrome c reductase cytochrome b subunit